MFNMKLKDLRKENNLTQKELAIALECSQSMITRWEKGECEPTESIIRRTALFFNVTSDYLIGLEDEYGDKTFIKTNIGNINNSGNINFH